MGVGGLEGQGGWQGKEQEVGRRMQTGRRGEQAFPESQNKIIQKTEEKQNKMDKQKKNRKPVNQGKSYV